MVRPLRFGLIPWQFQNKINVPMRLVKGCLSWLKVHYDGWKVLGGIGCLGAALVDLLCGEMDYNTADGFGDWVDSSI